MNELIGDVVLATVLMAVLYFVVMAKLRMSFGLTVAMGVPFLLLLGSVMAGFQVMFAFLTVAVAILIAWVFQRIIKN